VRIVRRALPILYGAALVVTCLAAPAQAATPTATPYSANAVYSCNQAAKADQKSCFAIKRTDIKQPQVIAPQLPSGYGPTSLQAAYKLSGGTTTATVAIIDAYDDPNAESDLATYRSTYGLPACTTANGCFKKVNQNGAASPLPTGDTGWAGEISLDVDMVSAVCPTCHILLVESNLPDDSLYTAVDTARTMGAKFISMSWGGTDDSTAPSYDSQYFNHPGVVYTASSGDSGYSAGTIYPSTSQYVVSVGGTSLNTSTNARGYTESVWSGAGSGCASSVTKPSFQSGISACTKRADTDVSAVADPNTGVAVYQTYGATGWAVYGGTSASAPIIASVYALAGTPGASDRPNSYPYAHTANLFDVTTGSNGSCTPTTLCKGAAGWDGPTGLGTPNGTAAFVAGSGGTALAATNPGSQTGTVGTAASLQLSASGGTAPYTWTATGLPTGLSISSGGAISGTPSAAGTFSVTATAKDAVNATASATFSWTISSVGTGCAAAGQKLGNAGFESGTSPWTATSGVVSATSTSEPSHGGSYLAWLDGYGTTHTDSVTQSVSIPAGCHATLTFWLHIDSAEGTTTAYDKLTVKAGSTTLATYSNVNKAAGYAQKSFDVSALAGQTVTVSFSGTEDSSLQTSFTIDDTALTAS
jgi:hypothetical protein